MNIGIELLKLDTHERNTLMKGLVLRRILPGHSLNRDQLGVAIEADFEEIKRTYSAFDPIAYFGGDMKDIYNGLLAGGTLSERPDPQGGPAMVDRGQFAQHFLDGLDDDMEWLIEMTPMSLRGFFDDLKTKPDKVDEIVLTNEEFDETHSGGKRRVIVDGVEEDDDDHSTRGGVILP